MAYPFIQAFYSPGNQLGATEHHDTAISVPGDAFTIDELESTLDPLKSPFNPSHEYTQHNIGELAPGTRPVKFIGRVVSFTTQYRRSNSNVAATGWHQLIVKDNTGAICVSNLASFSAINVIWGSSLRR